MNHSDVSQWISPSAIIGGTLSKKQDWNLMKGLPFKITPRNYTKKWFSLILSQYRGLCKVSHPWGHRFESFITSQYNWLWGHSLQRWVFAAFVLHKTKRMPLWHSVIGSNPHQEWHQPGPDCTHKIESHRSIALAVDHKQLERKTQAW